MPPAPNLGTRTAPVHSSQRLNPSQSSGGVSLLCTGGQDAKHLLGIFFFAPFSPLPLFPSSALQSLNIAVKQCRRVCVPERNKVRGYVRRKLDKSGEEVVDIHVTRQLTGAQSQTGVDQRYHHPMTKHTTKLKLARRQRTSTKLTVHNDAHYITFLILCRGDHTKANNQLQ